MRKKLKLGVIGCGAVAYRWYLNGLCNDNSFFELYAVCDIDENRAKKAAKDYGASFWFIDIKQMVKNGLDVAVVLTRHNDHFKQIQYLLQKGVHVYSEKPMAETAKKAYELVTLAHKYGLKLGSAPQVMFSSRNKRVKKLINDGKIGKVVLVRASCSNLGPAGRKDTNYDPEWFYQEGGSLRSLGIYGLAALIWILGVPKRVSGFQSVAIPERTVLYGPYAGKKFHVRAPDNVAALFSYENGSVVLYDGSYSVPNPPPYDFEIHGTKGSLLVGGFGGPASVLYKSVGGRSVEVGPNDDCHIRWNLSWGAEDLAKSVVEKREPVASSSFAISVLNVIEAIEKSSKNGKSITL